MRTLKSMLRMSLLSLAILGLAVTIPLHAADKENKDEPEDKELSKNGQQVTNIGTANMLLEYGLENKKPEAIATAIIMLVDNYVKADEELETTLKTHLKESLATARKADKGDAHEKLLNLAEERIGELGKTKGVQGGPHSLKGSVSSGQTKKVGNGYIYLKGICTLTIQTTNQNVTKPLVVSVHATRPGNPRVAYQIGRTVIMNWYSPDRETYNIHIHYPGPGTVHWVLHTN